MGEAVRLADVTGPYTTTKTEHGQVGSTRAARSWMFVKPEPA